MIRTVSPRGSTEPTVVFQVLRGLPWGSTSWSAIARGWIVTSTRLRKSRRWAVLVILLAAALITPSGDPLTLMLLSVPLYAMFELTILAIRFILKK